MYLSPWVAFSLHVDSLCHSSLTSICVPVALDSKTWGDRLSYAFVIVFWVVLFPVIRTNYDKCVIKQCIIQICFFKLIKIDVILCACCFPPSTSCFWWALVIMGSCPSFIFRAWTLSLSVHLVFSSWTFLSFPVLDCDTQCCWEHYWVLSWVQIFEDPEGRVFNLGIVDTLDLMFLFGDSFTSAH